MAIWTHATGKPQIVALEKTARGMACILCASGPSLDKVDTSKLKGPGRVVVGINYSYPMLKPDYWLGMDGPEVFPEALFSEAFPKIMRGGYYDRPFQGAPVGLRPFTYFCDVIEKNEHGMFEFEYSGRFCWTWNTFQTALQFAMWLGCQTIYLVGVDLDSTDKHYCGNIQVSEENRLHNQNYYNQVFVFLKTFVPLAKSYGYRIISSTEGSKINDVMPYVPLEQALESC